MEGPWGAIQHFYVDAPSWTWDDEEVVRRQEEQDRRDEEDHRAMLEIERLTHAPERF